MIFYIHGDLFQSPTQVLVNAVNTKGVMGKGIALRFKQFYPEMFRKYQHYCESNLLTVGTLQLYKSSHKWVLNFPTKRHWRESSKVEYIEAGLQNFRSNYVRKGIKSVAFPALGCGNGELDYEAQVRPLLERYLRKIPIPIFLYLPRKTMELPEHRNIVETRQWLRSTPSLLPFSEVWEGLSDVLGKSKGFMTFDQSKSFTARIEEEGVFVFVTGSGARYEILKKDILDFWQQLRHIGVIHADFVSRHQRAEFLLPIFKELPYIRGVSVSRSPFTPPDQSRMGLLSVPPSFKQQAVVTNVSAPRFDGF